MKGIAAATATAEEPCSCPKIWPEGRTVVIKSNLSIQDQALRPEIPPKATQERLAGRRPEGTGQHGVEGRGLGSNMCFQRKAKQYLESAICDGGAVVAIQMPSGCAYSEPPSLDPSCSHLTILCSTSRLNTSKRRSANQLKQSFSNVGASNPRPPSTPKTRASSPKPSILNPASQTLTP